MKKNFLDYVPVKNKKHKSYINKKNFIVIIIIRDGLLDKLIRKFHKIPDKLEIELDEIGSFFWSHIDDKKNIYQICEQMKKRFGKDAEPVYARAIEFTKILNNNNLIKLVS